MLFCESQSTSNLNAFGLDPEAVGDHLLAASCIRSAILLAAESSFSIAVA